MKVSIIDWIIKKLKRCIAIVEEGNTASQAIGSGKYVMWKGNLYTADTAISSGTTLAASGGSKNLTAVADGGYNDLNGKISTLNSKITSVDISNRTELLSALSALGENQTQSISIYGDIATEAIGWQGRTFGILSKTAASRFELAVFTANGQKIVVSEINASTGALENKQMFRPQAFQTKEYSYAYSITANSSLSVSVSNLNVSTPTGYTPISIVNINTANDNVLPRGFRCDVTTGNMVWLRNVAGSTQTGTLYVKILYTLTG